MKFQKKIMVNYIVFSALLALVFGVFYYTVNMRQYKEKEYGNISTVSDVKLQQFEDMLESMETVSTYLLSNQEILEALSTLSSSSLSETDEAIFFNSASSAIRSQLNTDYLMSHFYRVIVFNRQGIVIANNNYSSTQLNPKASIETVPWIEQVAETKGEDVIVGMHTDDWGRRQTPQVLSVVMEIQGGNRGYIEVQQEQVAIDEMMEGGTENLELDYFVFTKSGELLYQSSSDADAFYYGRMLTHTDKKVKEIRDDADRPALLLEQQSKKQGLTFVTVNHVDLNKMAIQAVLPLTLIVLLCFLLFSFGYIYLTAGRLVKPIRLLQTFMENIQLNNMQAEIPEKISNDEIEALYISFQDLLRRLDESIVKERRLSVLQLQSQFDLLQAQVNPHFIYNVLNVISNRGIENDDEVICDICSDLAGMLRYSTNTKEKYATDEEEKQYLEKYLGLLKYRYDYKLTYEIKIEATVYDKMLPKIVIQQIVENSITHGYAASADIIRITIEGYEDEKGWHIRVCDNGCGVSEVTLAGIDRSMEEIRRKLRENREHVEMEIGGMGLVNTYARLYLLYADTLMLKICSNEGNGTEVVLSVLNTAPDMKSGV